MKIGKVTGDTVERLGRVGIQAEEGSSADVLLAKLSPTVNYQGTWYHLSISCDSKGHVFMSYMKRGAQIFCTEGSDLCDAAAKIIVKLAVRFDGALVE